MSTTEVFNASQVKSVMSEIGSEFSDLSSLVEETNSLVTSALGSPDKAVYGDAGNKILATWDENCSTLSSFINIFNNWSLVAVSVASEYGELDTGTAKVEGTDLEAFKTISGANKTTWLKTSEGASNYTGSKNSYMDPTTNNTVSEQSSLSNRREITYTDANGNKITEYYNLAGELIGIKKNGKLYDANGKSVSEIGTKEELERADKIKKAQTSLKDSVKTKHQELEKRNKERTELSKYKNSGGLSGSHLDFVNSLIKGAVKAYKKYGVLPSLTLAQAICESGWGESSLSANYNNFFGIKAGSNWKGKTVVMNTGEQNPDGSTYRVNATFRAYDDLEGSIEDHAILLTNDRYKPVIASKNYKEACRTVRECGYATSLSYTDTLISIIEDYGLDQWDPK